MRLKRTTAGGQLAGRPTGRSVQRKKRFASVYYGAFPHAAATTFKSFRYFDQHWLLRPRRRRHRHFAPPWPLLFPAFLRFSLA